MVGSQPLTTVYVEGLLCKFILILSIFMLSPSRFPCCQNNFSVTCRRHCISHTERKMEWERRNHQIRVNTFKNMYKHVGMLAVSYCVCACVCLAGIRLHTHAQIISRCNVRINHVSVGFLLNLIKLSHQGCPSLMYMRRIEFLRPV